MEEIGLCEAKWVKSITTAPPSFLDILKIYFICIKRSYLREPKSFILSVLTSTCWALESKMAFSASSRFHFYSGHKEEKA